MEGEVGAFQRVVVAFDGNGICAGVEEVGVGAEVEQFKLVEGLVLGDVGGILAAAFANAGADGFLAIEVDDECIVVADRQPEVFGGLGIFEFEGAAGLNAGVMIAHVEHGGVVSIAIAEAGLAEFPG